MNPKKNTTVTNGPWCFSTLLDHATGTITIGCFRVRRPTHHGVGGLYQVHSLDGRTVGSDAEATALGLLHGVLKRYGRNTVTFTASNRSRKAGIPPGGGWRDRRAARPRPAAAR